MILRCKMCGGNLLPLENATTCQCDSCGTVQTIPRLEQSAAASRPAQANVQSLLGRAFMALEDGEWDKADDFCEQVLNQDYQNARAYLGKMMAEMEIRRESDLSSHAEPLDTSGNYQKALRFADDGLKATLTGVNDVIKSRNEQSKMQGEYDRCMSELRDAVTVASLQKIKQRISSLEGFKGVPTGLKACDDKIESINVKNYNFACDLMTQKNYVQAAADFRAIGDYRDSKELSTRCDELAALEAKIKSRKTKKGILIAAIAAAVVIAVILLVTKVIIPNGKYCDAVALQQTGQYEDAIAAFEALGDYKDCEEQIRETKYLKAKSLLEKKDYAGAAVILITLKGYKDVDTLLATDENLKAAIAAREAKLKPYRMVGSYVTYGTYPKTRAGNDSTPIEWLVLDYDAENDRTLLISRYGLDCRNYNSSHTSVTWETCTLRKWLNDTFLNKAFSKVEQRAILLTDVDNSISQHYSRWNTTGGNNTQDKVFILSYGEANKYFNVKYWEAYGAENNTKSRVAPTAYAIVQGAYTYSHDKNNDGRASGFWWLRSPGPIQCDAAYVYTDGSMNNGSVDSDCMLVRPAFWLDLSGI